jgi:phage portal protein BeeE
VKRWEALLQGRQAEQPGTAARGSFQDWVDLISSPLLQTTWGKISDEELTQNVWSAYKQNGPTFALTLARMQVFSQARFQWTRFSGGRPADLFGSPELELLERPWPGGTTADLLARMEMHVTTAGNAYVRRTSRTRLNTLRPEWVTIVLGSNEDAEHPGEAADVELVGYLYKPGGQGSNERTIALEPHEVAHYAPIPDPDNHFLGMSWITPVITGVQADDATELHKRKFFTNAATPQMAIQFDPTVTLEQIREFKALMEEEHRGTWNAWKTLYLGGGADAKVVGKDFKEIDFAATQGRGESRLASAAGVPPSWVGFSEGLQGSALNAGNFTAARRRFGDGTLHHLWANASSSLEVLLRRPDAGAHLWYDTRSIPFLREDAKDAAEVQTNEAQTIANLVKEGFTPESAIKAVQNQDWSLLEHTGLVSVQLQVPGSTAPTANGDQ